ncbi:hypothetical protein CLV74_101373 [Donghicola tyrosinivorans]|uniref:Uncharacterized protein n=1 Tax=Donghicola tyrosinivorans TaxID=1652492 RepID=A0A2T0X5P3_9RHOB|nr:hypothetical protein CLV74_101373 [Donghicola tyrosinivorans]
MSKTETFKNSATQRSAALSAPLVLHLETNTATQQEVLQAIHALPFQISQALDPLVTQLEEQKAQNVQLLERMEKQDQLMRSLGKLLQTLKPRE